MAPDFPSKGLARNKSVVVANKPLRAALLDWSYWARQLMGCLDPANQRAWPCLVGRILCVLDVAEGGPFSSVWHIKPEKRLHGRRFYTRKGSTGRDERKRVWSGLMMGWAQFPKGL